MPFQPLSLRSKVKRTLSSLHNWVNFILKNEPPQPTQQWWINNKLMLAEINHKVEERKEIVQVLRILIRPISSFQALLKIIGTHLQPALICRRWFSLKTLSVAWQENHLKKTVQVLEVNRVMEWQAWCWCNTKIVMKAVRSSVIMQDNVNLYSNSINNSNSMRTGFSIKIRENHQRQLRTNLNNLPIILYLICNQCKLEVEDPLENNNSDFNYIWNIHKYYSLVY